MNEMHHSRVWRKVARSMSRLAETTEANETSNFYARLAVFAEQIANAYRDITA